MHMSIKSFSTGKFLVLKCSYSSEVPRIFTLFFIWPLLRGETDFEKWKNVQLRQYKNIKNLLGVWGGIALLSVVSHL
jgi:hypothetical protein